jgi:hypothetical protein
LFYDSSTDGITSGEPSRFLLQAEVEWTKNPAQELTVVKKVYNPKFHEAGHSHRVAKDPEIMAALNEICNRGFSPSSLALYLKNPMDFLLEYVLKIKETDPPDLLNPMTIGTLYHGVMEKFFQPFIGQELTADSLHIDRSEVEEHLREVADQADINWIDLSGARKLRWDMLIHQLWQSINAEKKYLEKRKRPVIQHLERKMRAEIIPNVWLRGIADRIETLEGETWIIDYKTGNPVAKDLKFGDDATEKLKEGGPGFQLMCYAWLLKMTEAPASGMRAALFKARDWDQGWLEIADSKNRGTKGVREEWIDAIDILLKSLVEEILNPDIPFVNREKIEDEDSIDTLS